MNIMKTKTENKIISNETWNHAAAKGALVWGSVYSTATTSAACLLAPVVNGGSVVFSDVFVDSLILFPSFGAARGLLMWRLRKNKGVGSNDPLEPFTSKGVKPHKHPVRIKKAA